MGQKYVGAILILIGFVGFGFQMGADERKEARYLRQLIRILKRMKWELQYRLSDLPELCGSACEGSNGKIADLFRVLSGELRECNIADISECIISKVSGRSDLPESIKSNLIELGNSLGKFDLSGQIEGLEKVCLSSEEALNTVEHNKTSRQRSYRVLSACAGAALVVLLM